MTDRLVTLEDRRAVYALLDRMLDWLPPARLGLRRPEVEELGVGQWARCSRCETTGRVRGEGLRAKPCRLTHDHHPYGHGCRPCLVCEDGWVRVGKDGSDPMLTAGKSEMVDDSNVRTQRRRWVDAQLVKLAALAEEHAGNEAPDDAYTRAERAKRHQYQSGSFAALEQALDLLAIVLPSRHASVVFFVVERQLAPDHDVRARLDETVDWIAARMPPTIVLPGDAVDELAKWKHELQHGKTAAHRAQRAERDAEIVRLRVEHGWRLADLAKLYGLTAEGVRGIVQTSAYAGKIVPVQPATATAI